MLRRKFDRLLSEGEGKQLAWLTGIVLLLFVVFCLIGSVLGLDWKQVLSLYLDAGNFPLDGETSDVFSLIVTFSGLLILSALLISIFSNVLSNIAEAYRKGEKRYRLKNHIVILGGGRHLLDMLKALKTQKCDNDILVMSSSETEELRAGIETALDDRKFCSQIVWYRGNRENKDDIYSTCAQDASLIYIIGESGEESHDAVSISALDILSGICCRSGRALPCYLTLEERTAIDVYRYMPAPEKTSLRIEIINSADYISEQLLVNTEFIPIPDNGSRIHIVIAGSERLAESFACVASQICHFPDFAVSGKRTLISFVGDNMKARMEYFVSEYRNMFELSHYSYVSEGKLLNFVPEAEFGDFLDVEWEFIDGNIDSEYVRNMLVAACNDNTQKLALAVCGEKSSENLSIALHLPREIYEKDVPVAVYQSEHSELLDKAASTGMYDNIRCYGEAYDGSDALLQMRSSRGKRVNYLYARVYGSANAVSPDEAWAGLSFAHKMSSIASANSIPIKLRAFDIVPSSDAIDALSEEKLDSLSEVEHRRWMSSVLLMGYRAATASERKDRNSFKKLKSEKYIHLDIAPYDEIASETDKDLLIVKNIPYILGLGDIR